MNKMPSNKKNAQYASTPLVERKKYECYSAIIYSTTSASWAGLRRR
jgi:hypothetical protein